MHKQHILFCILYVYIIYTQLELTLNRWSWNKPKSHYLSFEVNNIDYVKPLILAFLWVIFDINHLLQTGLRSEQPPPQPSVLHCTWMDTAHMLAAECSYYPLPVSVGQMMVLVHFNSFKLINLTSPGSYLNVD